MNAERIEDERERFEKWWAGKMGDSMKGSKYLARNAWLAARWDYGTRLAAGSPTGRGNEYHLLMKPSPPATTVEALAEAFHNVYQEEAKRQGDVRHKDSYADLSENVKEFDRALARYVLMMFPAPPSEIITDEKARELLTEAGYIAPPAPISEEAQSLMDATAGGRATADLVSGPPAPGEERRREMVKYLDLWWDKAHEIMTANKEVDCRISDRQAEDNRCWNTYRKIKTLILRPAKAVTSNWVGKLAHEGYLMGAYNDSQERFVSMLREVGVEVGEK